ncbi:uncharacterized protein LOC119375032 [Rhipicephalus sanguineus]|uniref:uncharacterized protein LOC119375032 n=1 Tax=Rhipicephalus sanguineus TaxID=34632 RepID=UPI0018935919|nr:uncharacterized protein LOC119375032 [Rhipicephalus sanguineus]
MRIVSKSQPHLTFHQYLLDNLVRDLMFHQYETTRYYHIATVLPPDVASEISHVFSNPSGTTPYQYLKTKVLERFMPSERARLQQPLAEGDVGDGRPSKVLRRMRQLLGQRDVSINSALLRELFFQSLSQPFRLVLVAAGDVNLDRLAELADQAHEATFSSVTAVLPPEDIAISRPEARIDELAASVAAIQSPLQDTLVFSLSETTSC